MKTGKDFLKRLDEAKFSEAAKIINTDKLDVGQTALVEEYKKKDLVEYLDKNRDKELSMSTYSEGEPVFVGDDYAPHARKRGKVISKGEVEGTVKVKFDDGDHDIPTSYIHKQPQQVDEHFMYALTAQDGLYKVLVESTDIDIDVISKYLGEQVVLTFPEKVNIDLFEESLTDEQMAKREEIVTALKRNSRQLKKTYGERWKSVAYAIATKKALGEELTEGTDEVVFKQRFGEKVVMIVKRGEYFVVRKESNSGTVDIGAYDTLKDAEAVVLGGV